MANEKRSKLRSLTVAAKKNFKNEIVDWEGEKFEIRQPSVGTRGEIMQRARESEESVSFNVGAMQIWMVIYCTYIPGTNELVFTEEDYANLNEHPTGTFLDKFVGVATRLVNMTPVEDAKNSVEALSDNSSSESPEK